MRSYCVGAMLLSLSSAAAVGGVANHNAEEARWVVHSSNWGYMSTTLYANASIPAGSVASYSDGAAGASTGRLFFYIMTAFAGGDASPTPSYAAALTMSEAVLDPADYGHAQCGSRAGVDPEDPRCAKITLSGDIIQSTGDDIATGKAALFARHPQMKEWPSSHGFSVFEMKISSIWMISNYGGGATITPDDCKVASCELLCC